MRNSFRGDRLVLRIKWKIQDNPFLLLHFYWEVLLHYSSSVFRRFLIQKKVKFSSS